MYSAICWQAKMKFQMDIKNYIMPLTHHQLQYLGIQIRFSSSDDIETAKKWVSPLSVSEIADLNHFNISVQSFVFTSKS